MKKPNGTWLASILVLLSVPRTANSQDTGKQPLRLVQTISMPNLTGRLDHMDVDVKGKRLFVARLENGTLEVVDLRSGKWLRSLRGLKKPQGALYVEELNKLFVASRDDAMLRVFKRGHAGSSRLHSAWHWVDSESQRELLFASRTSSMLLCCDYHHNEL